MSKPKFYGRASLVAETISRVGDAKDTAEFHGRWKLNAGNEMMVKVDGVNGGKPIRLVVDLSTVKAKNNKIHALFDHNLKNIIGYWDNFEFTPEGIFADLHLIGPQSTSEAAVFPDVVRTRAMVRDGVPIQVSIGADSGDVGEWEMVAEKVNLNGREYNGEGEIPLVVLRNGEIFESSVVTFGADDQTGRLAAKADFTTPLKKEGTHMSDTLKVLIGKYPEKHHGLIARCVAEGCDEATIQQKVHASEDEDLKAQLAAKDEEIKCLKAKLDDYAQKGQEKQERETAEKVAAAAAKGKGSTKAISFTGTDDTKTKTGEEVAQPETLSQAMKVMAAADSTLKGFKLRAAARKQYPNVSEK
jgi:hypothetical protein